MISPSTGTGPRHRIRRLASTAPWKLALVAVFLSTAPAEAQLGPGDLQRAHALTANAAGWIALRSSLRHIVEASGIAAADAAEDTADTLAVLLGLEDGQGQLDAVLIGAVRGALTAYSASDTSAAGGFADNGLTRARAKAIACLIYGQAPDERRDMADALGLSAAEVEYCPAAYTRLRDHWISAAAPLRAATSGPGAPATVELVPAGGAMASARAVLIAGQTLNEVGAFVSTALASPRPLQIRSVPCEGSGPPGENEIRVCYELVGEIATGIERGIVSGR